MLPVGAGVDALRVYVGDGDLHDPDVAPIDADVGGLPPTLIVTAEYDALCLDGEAYAARLREAGVPVTLSQYDGMVHGFFTAAGVFDDAQRAVDEAGAALREAFASVPAEEASMTATIRSVRVGDVSLEIAEAGVGGRPLLMVHGFTGAKEDFADFFDQLADARLARRRPRPPGSRSQRPSFAPRTTASTCSRPTCWPSSTTSAGTASCCSATRWAA